MEALTQENSTGTKTTQQFSELFKALGISEEIAKHVESEPIPEGNYFKSEQYKQSLQRKADFYNSTKGNLTGCDCEKCNNKGVFMYINDDLVETCRPCDCMTIRECAAAMRNSGIDENILNAMTFDSYNAAEEWQARMKKVAFNYMETIKSGDTEHWLLMSGQSGAGKTHLSTAVCVELMKAGFKVKYMTWHEIVHKLTQAKFNEERYNNVIALINNAEILYIDDLFKTEKAEKDIAFEVLNMRYVSKKPTIISCELNLDGITDIDTATAGRITHMSKGFTAQIKADENRNYRRKL